MTILWMDGFDLYNNITDFGANYSVGAIVSFSTTTGRFGGGAIFTNNYGVSRATTANSEIWLSFAMQPTSYASNVDQIICGFGSAGGVEGTITYNGFTGTLKSWRGNRSTQLSTQSLIMTVSTWHWFDVRWKMHASTGEVEVWIDDVQQISLTSQNTIQNSGQTQVSTILLQDTVGIVALPGYIDDVFIYTPGSRLGDSRIETLVPTSDAGTNQATPSTGTNHWAVVDEAQFNTSDYLTMANTSGNREIFGHGSLSGTPTTVHGVVVKLMSQKSDAGAFSLAPLVVSSGTEADGSGQSLSTSWSQQYSLFVTDPHTSAAWTYSAVNSASIGYMVP
jgi:hypothetical protein